MVAVVGVIMTTTHVKAKQSTVISPLACSVFHLIPICPKFQPFTCYFWGTCTYSPVKISCIADFHSQYNSNVECIFQSPIRVLSYLYMLSYFCTQKKKILSYFRYKITDTITLNIITAEVIINRRHA